MAKGTVNVGSRCREIVSAVKSGQFAPVYLLMGDEPYYTDMVCDAVIENALDEASPGFQRDDLLRGGCRCGHRYHSCPQVSDDG